ncbi:MAG TPA: quinone oxidoreductase [Polyangiaceae bacterium]|nr:quinone oxidoreductase [Polyangiaceae bacterium]
MTRAVLVTRTGGPEVLELGTIELPPPGPGEALVRHTVIGVNMIDAYHRSGLYKLALPTVIGTEAAGIVEAIGPGTGLAVGTRVGYAGTAPGAYAEARIMPADRLVRLPDDISDETAAAVLLKGMTAEFLIRRTFAVRPGNTVLLHAAAGGVGLIAGQWLKALGARVIGVVGTEEKAKLAREHGCADVLMSGKDDIAARVRALTAGRGVDVVYDSVGKATFAASLDSLAPRGMLVAFGNASGRVEPFDPLLLSQKGSLYLTRPTLGHYIATTDELRASASALFSVIQRGAVRVVVGQRFPLAEVAAAHRALEGRATVGSTLLTL